MLNDGPIRVPQVSIKPSHITFYYDFPEGKRSRNSEMFPREMPKSNKAGMELSEKSRKRLTNGINWLLELAEVKRVFNNRTKKYFNFKVNFITLTLPCLQAHYDTTIKSVCFNNFLTELRKYHGLKNYVWRAELQGNGNIHFHIATDTFFHWAVIRRIWNRLLKKLGYIDRYHDKFSGLSFQEYRKIVDISGKADLSKLYSAWEYGVKTNWRDPNTTDIHKLKKVKNVAAYLAKYMAKKAKKSSGKKKKAVRQRRLLGRQWGQSQSLSRCRSIIMDVANIHEKLIDYCEKNFKPKWIIDQYYSVMLVRMSDWKKGMNKFYTNIISKLKSEIDFSPGDLAKSLIVN